MRVMMIEGVEEEDVGDAEEEEEEKGAEKEEAPHSQGWGPSYHYRC